MSTISKYWEKYSASFEKPAVKDEYTTFLEAQLDKVANVLRLNQGFNERIETLQTQLNTADDKIRNLTQLVKLQQSYAETQEEELKSYRAQAGRPDPAWEHSLLQAQQRQTQLQQRLENALTHTEAALLQRLERAEQTKHAPESRLETLTQRLADCETSIRRVEGLLQTTNEELRRVAVHQAEFEDSLESKVSEALKHTRSVLDQYVKTQKALKSELKAVKADRVPQGILRVSSDTLKAKASSKSSTPRKRKDSDSKNTSKRSKGAKPAGKSAKPVNRLQQLHDALVNA